ncbi:MAG TPA: DUF1028 domain-containing protein [Ignavibacteria bacterium]|nr:DUF1028 domain-containing protein [Ignavibacteria bacterium]
MKNIILFLILTTISLISNKTYSQDTFSICAIDTITGEVGSAGASCVNDCTILTDVFPGWGIVHTQASWLSANQNYARSLMLLRLDPQAMIDSLVAHDAQNNPSVRQYLIINKGNGTPKRAAYTGANCLNYKNHIIGPNYVIAGNILSGQPILDSMEARFLREEGSISDKIMAALQGAKVVGADTRCASWGTSSKSAFIRVAKPSDTLGILYLNLKVLNTPFGRDPIDSLQVLYNNWTLTGITSAANEVVSGYKLFQNYPNPFNPKTVINYELQITGYDFVNLKVFDVLGNEVATLVNEKQNSGSYTVDFDGSNFPSGMYYYKMEVNGILKDVKRMVLLK